MKHLVLPGTDLRVSVLGFGCAPIMGRVDRSTALDALEHAYDHGVNYFDVARSYGYGDAEAVVGEFLKGRREEVVVATKIGLSPPSHQRFLKLALPIARELMSWLPERGRDLLRSTAVKSGTTEPEQQFGVKDVRESLETSLQALGTDYVDVLLLHACHPKDAADPKLRKFLDSCVEKGKVRHYGLATSVDACSQVTREYSAFRVAQFAHNVQDPGLDDFPTDRGVATITHSPFGQEVNLIQRLTSYVSQHPEAGQMWSARVGLDMRYPSNIAKVLLSYALRKNQTGVVLCGMFDGNHLAANVGTVSEPVSSEALNEVVHSMRKAVKN
jgi:aryl-alcohol dehydrogenase-like predicted oxidoreductase